MVYKIKEFFGTFHTNLLANFKDISKKSKVLFLVSIYLLLLSIFSTIVGQAPILSSRGLTVISQLPWVLVIIPLLLFDYKKVLKYLLFLLIVIIPFIIYLVIAQCSGIKSISFDGTKYIFLCAYLFLLGALFSKYLNKTIFKSICLSFLLGATLYALIVYFAKLKGSDLSSGIYAFDDKNSAGPIFLIGALMAFFVFDKKSVWQYILRYGFFAFFVGIIALSKCRAVLICVPVIFFLIIIFDLDSFWVKFGIIGTIFLIAIIIVCVPQLNNLIIVNILFNNKTDIDSIFSGRINKIATAMQTIKPILGNGGYYVDCMPICLLCSYGIVGLITLLPILVLPFFSIYKSFKDISNRRKKQLLLMITIIYLVGMLLEGYGFLGTGAKVFILWIFAGFSYTAIVPEFSRKHINKPINAISKGISNIKPNALIVTISIIILAFPFIGTGTNCFGGTLGKTIVDKLPESNATAKYNAPQNVHIVNKVGTMCLGQRIFFEAACDNEDGDVVVYWSTGWISNPSISVDANTGMVTANVAPSNALLHIDYYTMQNGTYIQFPIKETNDYEFKMAYLSSNKFYKSFEYNENEEIELGKQCTLQLYYDEFYVPETVDFTFYSSNPNVASVNPKSGLVTAHNEGSATIYGMVNSYRTANEIKVNVSNSTFVPVTSIKLEKDICYQYEDYDISPIFNDRASDTNFTLSVEGMDEKDYVYKDQKIRFNKSGNVTLRAQSLNNPLIVSEPITLDVIENKPIKFECETNRMIVGETKSSADLGLYIVYESGHKFIVQDSDLLYNARDFSNRASANKNGMSCSSRTIFKAIAVGSLNINLTSIINQELSASFKLTVSPYTEAEYKQKILNANTIVVCVIAALVSIVFLFIQFRHKFLFVVTSLLYGAAIIIFFLNMYNFSQVAIVCSIVIGITLIALNLIYYVLLECRCLFKLEEQNCTLKKEQQIEQHNITI